MYKNILLDLHNSLLYALRCSERSLTVSYSKSTTWNPFLSRIFVLKMVNGCLDFCTLFSITKISGYSSLWMAESCVTMGPTCCAIKVSERKPKFTHEEGMRRLDLGKCMTQLISSFFSLSDKQKYWFFIQNVIISAIWKCWDFRYSIYINARQPLSKTNFFPLP